MQHQNQKLFRLIVIFLVLVVVALTLDFLFFQITPLSQQLPSVDLSRNSNSPPSQSAPDLSATTFTGTLQCLPQSGPDCPYALKTATGDFYSLAGLSTQDLQESEFKIGQQVEIVGQLNSESTLTILSITSTL